MQIEAKHTNSDTERFSLTCKTEYETMRFPDAGLLPARQADLSFNIDLNDLHMRLWFGFQPKADWIRIYIQTGSMYHMVPT